MIDFTKFLPPFVRRLLQYVLGFGVGFSVRMAPFLGTYQVRFFPALLSIYPLQMQQLLIPLSAFLFGTVAVAVQYYSFNRRSDAILDRYFGRLLVSLLAAFLILVVLYKIFVVPVQVEETGHWVNVVIGLSRSANCCPAETGDSECVKEVSLNPAAINSCWKNVQLVELALSIPYLFLVSGFVALVGLLLFKDKGQAPGPAPARAVAKTRAKPRTGTGRSGKPPPARPADRRP